MCDKSFLQIEKVIRPSDGFTFECINKTNSVAIVLFNDSYSEVLLVKQYRAGSNDFLYELPAGIINENENDLDTVLREIEEETGYEKNNIIDIIDLGLFYVSPGYTSEQIHLFRARIKPKSNINQDIINKDKQIITNWIKLEEVEYVSSDMKTQLGISKALSIQKKKIGIYGGTFNPITYLHLLTVERAIEEFNLDLCILEPVHSSYEKESIIDSKHRSNMIQLAIENNNHLLLGQYEINEFGWVPTIETLRHYKSVYGWCEIYFICGSDVLNDMPHWSFIKELFSEFKVICVQRNNDNIHQNIILQNNVLLKNKNNINIIFENVVNNVSSSSIRNLVKNNLSIKYLVPESVEKYIYNNDLYK